MSIDLGVWRGALRHRNRDSVSRPENFANKKERARYGVAVVHNAI